MNSNIIRKRLDALRQRMEEECVQLYMISDTDFHMSAHPCGYFRTLEYVSGFTGADARMVVTEHNAHLWVPAEYRSQAEQELEGTGIIIHTVDDPEDEIGTLALYFAACGEAFFDNLSEDQIQIGVPKYIVGFDGRTFPFDEIDEMTENLGVAYELQIVVFNARMDLVGDIWTNRPPLPENKIEILDMNYAGVDVGDKLALIRRTLSSYGSDTGAVLTALDDIAWLFNIRGSDLPGSMTAIAYAYVSIDEALLFIDEKKVPGRIREYLGKAGVEVREYYEFYTFLEHLKEVEVLIDDFRSNFAVVLTIQNQPDVVMTSCPGLVEMSKAIRNPLERLHALMVNFEDSTAWVRFLKWLKENAGSAEVTERSAEEHLWALQREAGAIMQSLPAECAYQEHSAETHRASVKGSDRAIEKGGLLVIRAGAHYPGGTTHTGRTVILGSVSPEIRRVYTGVVQCILAAQNAVFPDGLTDVQLDCLIREPLWRMGCDYAQATGTGVGMMRNDAEGPQLLDWRKSDKRSEIRPGMITAVGPFAKQKGAFGVRIENEYCCIDPEDRPGFFKFSNLTYVPIDTGAIDTAMMTDQEIQDLNEYNQKVYDLIADKLTEEEGEWLRKETRPIVRQSGRAGRPDPEEVPREH